jgi:ABC-type transporter Mla subunit MlaD
MTAAPEDRKIRQLDNDVLAIYEKLDAITKTQGRHTGGLDELGSQLSRLTAIVDRQGNRLDELATTQDEHTAQLNRLTAIVERQGNRLDELAGVQEEHTATLAENTSTLAEHTSTLAEHGTKLDRILEILERR